MLIEATDTYLQHYQRKLIANMPYEQRVRLKSIAACNKFALPPTTAQGVQGVFVLRGLKSHRVRLLGVRRCNNPWLCPFCGPVKAQKAAANIDIAIKLKKQRDFAAVMLTLTIPHWNSQPLREVIDILYSVWRHTFCLQKQKRVNPWSTLRRVGELDSYVRATEITWSRKNGWHPHFHVLLFVPKGKLAFLGEHQAVLNAHWNSVFERTFRNYYTYGDSRSQSSFARFNVSDVLNEWKANPQWQKNAFFSLDDSGQYVRDCDCSDYIAGWGIDKEVVGNVGKKASHSGHFTPMQLLQNAADGDKVAKYFYEQFLTEMTNGTRHQRICFSNSLLREIKAYKQTESWRELCKKKAAQKEPMELVIWFTRKQWSKICKLDYEMPFISNILYLASLDDASLLYRFLENFDIWTEQPTSEIVKWAETHFSNVA